MSEVATAVKTGTKLKLYAIAPVRFGGGKLIDGTPENPILIADVIPRGKATEAAIRKAIAGGIGSLRIVLDE